MKKYNFNYINKFSGTESGIVPNMKACKIWKKIRKSIILIMLINFQEYKGAKLRIGKYEKKKKTGEKLWESIILIVFINFHGYKAAK